MRPDNGDVPEDRYPMPCTSRRTTNSGGIAFLFYLLVGLSASEWIITYVQTRGVHDMIGGTVSNGFEGARMPRQTRMSVLLAIR